MGGAPPPGARDAPSRELCNPGAAGMGLDVQRTPTSDSREKNPHHREPRLEKFGDFHLWGKLTPSELESARVEPPKLPFLTSSGRALTPRVIFAPHLKTLQAVC